MGLEFHFKFKNLTFDDGKLLSKIKTKHGFQFP